MTLMEVILVLLTSPLIATLCYGTWRFHVDPDGSMPVVGQRSAKSKERPAGSPATSPAGLTATAGAA